jgi:plastocyanin
MQVSRRHLPIVGLLGLAVVVAAGGGVYYYQFVVSHVAPSYVASHRMIFINATIVEASSNGHGFEIFNLAYLNQSSLPTFSAGQGANLTGVKYSNYKGESDNSTIDAHPGDTITFYIYSKSEPASSGQISGIAGHGFEVDSASGSVVIPNTTLTFGQWFEFTYTFSQSGTYIYRCTIFCSNMHPKMFGNISVG